ncbi:MAG: hypothetical protein K0S79_154 [Nitrospira sp.]|jgi:hypothetical protein|nr:hypothetical protein [Nitrospira sp.]
MFFLPENHVKRAVEIVGGPTFASNLLSVSNQCIHKWIAAERVPNLNQARKLSELSKIEVEKLRPV